MKNIVISLFLLIPVFLFSQTIYVAPNGLGTNSGISIDAPTSLENAFSMLENALANVLYFRGGEYLLTQRITLNRSGNASNILKILAYEHEKPIFNAINTPVTSDAEGIRFAGNYYHLKGFEVKNCYSFGIRVRGSYNLIEQCVAHHNGGTGIGISISHCDTNNPDGTMAAFNLIKNCDSFMNFSWYSSLIGGNADGFAASLRVGKGNKFVGCRAWSNSDDGWDLFKSMYDVQIDSCWTWGNGLWSDFENMYKEKTGNMLTTSNFRGDGNGFKMGGNGDGGSPVCFYESTGLKTLRNSVSFNNVVVGITQNNHKDGVLIENCVSFNNKRNIRYYLAGNEGAVFTFNNNIIFGIGTAESGIDIPSVSTGNSWQVGQPSFSASDFVTVNVSDAMAPRESDGSLPKNNFGRLKKDVSELEEIKEKNSFFFALDNSIHFTKPVKGIIYLYLSSGVLLQRIKVDVTCTSIQINQLQKGIYFIKLILGSQVFCVKYIN